MARVVAVFDDLLLGSNVLGTLRAAGHDATLTGGAGVQPDGADVLVVDLAAGTFDGVGVVESLTSPERSAEPALWASTVTSTWIRVTAPRLPGSISWCLARGWPARAHSSSSASLQEPRPFGVSDYEFGMTVTKSLVKERRRVIVRFAGDSGDGMQLAGSRFTEATAEHGNDFATLPSFPAEIRAPAGTLAGVSAFQIHFASQDILTPGDEPDVLVAMNPAALRSELPGARPRRAR